MDSGRTRNWRRIFYIYIFYLYNNVLLLCKYKNVYHGTRAYILNITSIDLTLTVCQRLQRKVFHAEKFENITKYYTFTPTRRYTAA